MVPISYILTTIALVMCGWLLLRFCSGNASIAISDRVEICLASLEKRIGLFASAILVSLLFLVAAMVYTRPVWELGTFGKFYATMASDPFSVHPEISFPHRILTPLISYMVGLRGDLILVTNLLLAWSILFSGYWYFRKRGTRTIDTLVALTVLTFSLVTLNSLFNSGYTDAMSLLLILLMWIFKKRPVVFYLCFGLGLFNRESVAFMLPWFAYLRWRETGGVTWALIREMVIGFGAAIIVYALFRYWVESRQDVVYSLRFYFGLLPSKPTYWFRQSRWLQFLGLFTVYKAVWLVPLAAAIAAWRKERHLFWSMLLLLACTWLQFFVAYDSSRLFTQGFLIAIVALEYLFRERPLAYDRWIGWLLLVNLAIPQWYTAADQIRLFKPWLAYFLE